VEKNCLPKAINSRSLICESNETEAAALVVALSTLEAISKRQLRSTATAIPETSTPLAVVLCNTKPDAVRVGTIFKNLSKYSNILPLTANLSLEAQRKLLQSVKPDIIVGTPARILHICQEKLLSMAEIKHFILMSADKTLDRLETRGDIQQILFSTPKNKHVMIFGSKLHSKVNAVCTKFMKEEPFRYSDFVLDPESAEIDIMD